MAENEKKENEIDENAEINIKNESAEVKEKVETAEVKEDINPEENNEENESAEKKETQEETVFKKELEEMKLFGSKLKDENKKLKNELETVKERLLRTSAEYENFRNRTAKEKDGIYSDACFDVLKNILPALDNMERAAAIDGSVEDLKKGIEMTIRQFNDSLSKLGVEEIDTSSEFDPNVHNAIMHVEDESVGENQIVEVLQKGYKKGDKIIRFSLVKVAN